MKTETYYCDLCNNKIADPESLKNSEFKIKMRPDGGYDWRVDEGQEYLELCDECEAEIIELLKGRYNIGHKKEVQSEQV